MGFLELFGKKQKPVEFRLPPLPQLDSPQLLSDIPPIQAEQHTEALQKPSISQAPVLLEQAEPTSTEIQEQPERIQTKPRPMFISTNDYKQILSGANMIRTKLEQADHIMNQLTALKNQQEQFFERWRAQLEDTEKKLTYIDTILENSR